MKFTLDLSGKDAEGNAGIDRFGGLFMSIEDAVSHGKLALSKGRLPFVPDRLWVRDQSGDVVGSEILPWTATEVAAHKSASVA